MPDLLRAELIDGNAADADVLARRFAHEQAGEKVCGFSVVTIAAMAVLFVEPGKDEQVLLVTRQWLEGEGKLEFGANIFRKPVRFPNTVRKVQASHADRRLNVSRYLARRDGLRGGGG